MIDAMGSGRPRGALVVCLGCALAFVVVTLLVVTHVTDHLDDVVRDVFRPHDEWGTTQLRADHIVEGLKPPIMALFLAAVAGAWSLHRRSWWPAIYAAAIGGCAVALVETIKIVLGRADPHGDVPTLGGSYPSGHTVSVLVCLGGALLVVRARTLWWQWLLVGLVALAMGVALLIEAAHWVTDVVGGALLAVALLASASTWPLRRRSAGDGAPVGQQDRPSQDHPGGSDVAAAGKVPPQEQARQA